jgi:uncharacterized membrane protein
MQELPLAPRPGARMSLSLIAFVLSFKINLLEDRVREREKVIRDQDLLRISSRNELRAV